MNPASPSHHCTQFTLDFVACARWKDSNSLHDYIERESNYDLSFCEAWINHVNAEIIDDAEKLFKFFMNIQKTAMHHIELIGETSEGQTYQSGICTHLEYSVSNSLVSDFEGIKELAGQIWFNGKHTRITVYSKKKPNGFPKIHFLDKNGFYNLNSRKM